MHLCYLDESGEGSPFVLAGFSAFERDTYWLAKDLDELEARLFPDADAPVIFHASEFGAFDKTNAQPALMAMSKKARIDAIHAVYDLIASSRMRLFAVVAEKDFTHGHPYQDCFEEILVRFDKMLGRLYLAGDKQRGLVVVADSRFRKDLASGAQRIWARGHRWGHLRNMADVPFFVPASSSRLLQLADFVANAVYRRYARGDARAFDAIAHLFDQADGRLHGLQHLTLQRAACMCIACLSRRGT